MNRLAAIVMACMAGPALAGTVNLTNSVLKVAEPTSANHAASKNYVDTADAALYPRNNPSNHVTASITNGLAPASWVTDNFLTEAIAETLYDALGATAAYSNWAGAYFYPASNPSNWVTAAVTNGLPTHSITNGLYPASNPSNWIPAVSVTNYFYPRNNPSNWIDAASVTNTFYPRNNPSNWVTASVTNDLWNYSSGTGYVQTTYYPRSNPSNWATAAVTGSVPTRAQVTNMITYETLNANSDVGVGSSQVALGSHGHNSYLWSIAYLEGLTNGVSEASTVATVYFKTNWATQGDTNWIATTNWVALTYYPRNNPSNWVTASVTDGLAQASWVTGLGYATNAGIAGGTMYAMSNLIWTAFTPGSGGGDASTATNPRAGIWGMTDSGHITPLTVIIEPQAGFWKMDSNAQIIVSGNNWTDAWWTTNTDGHLTARSLP